ncbi:MAG: NosD domain-containing protein, partial [Candidatus Zixiibacteriota bacterium]
MSTKTLILMIILIIMAMTGTLSAAVFNVPIDYTSIQSAIDVALPGDTVLIGNNNLPGIYNLPYFENIIIDKQLALIGAGGIISGQENGDAILISAGSCLLKKLVVYGSGHFQPAIGSWDAGIKIKYADSCTIDSCRMLGNAAGLVIEGSNYTQVRHNLIINNQVGIYFY